jgi:hypothetical protein
MTFESDRKQSEESEMTQEDLQQIVESGERLPKGMFDPELLTDEDVILLPVFDGEKLTQQEEE